MQTKLQKRNLNILGLAVVKLVYNLVKLKNKTHIGRRSPVQLEMFEVFKALI